MNEKDLQRIAAWLVERGLAGASETELLHGLCERCCQAGLALSRTMIIIDTLHPVYEGRLFRWRSDGVEESAVIEYGPSNVGEGAANWQSSTFYHLWKSGTNELRRRIGLGDPVDFRLLATLNRKAIRTTSP
jgi:adenylate cyclase